MRSNFPTAPETKPTAYPSATTRAEKSFRPIPAILVIGVSIYSVEVFREMGGFDPGTGDG
ncbi:hypothetical protein QUB76_32435 [Microcoleus sp. D2B6]